MNLRQLICDNCNGATFISLDTETEVKLLGGKSNPFQGRVTKRVVGSNVMVFQNKKTNAYENMVERRLIAEGKDPSSFQLGPRAWGTRVEGTPIIEHNEGEYLEVIFLRAGEVTYLVDGIPTPKEAIQGIADKVEGVQGGLNNKVIIRTYALESIKAITINKERYSS